MQRAIAWVRRHPVAAVLVASAACMIVATAVVAGYSAASFVRFSERLERFVAESRSLGSQERPAAITISRVHFRYAGNTRFVEVPVSAAELAQARALDTSRVFASSRVVRGAYLRRLVADQSRHPVIERTAEELRSMRRRLKLDENEYVEFMARYVQSIPYGEVDGRVRPPGQVLAENVAACDDRSVLLASLLFHEGYDTALFTFEGQAHAAVGVRSADRGYRGTGYAFIETTRPAFVGEVGGRYIGFAAWRPVPHLVRLGGRSRYTAEHESSLVARRLERAREQARYLARYRGLSRTGPPRWRAVYRAAEMQQVEAEQLVAVIEANDFDREAIYRLLSKGGGGL